MSAALVRCSDCHRWASTSGSPICGICRVSRAISLLPADPRLSSNNFDLIHSILERCLGEVNSWLCVPLEFPPASLDNGRASPAAGETSEFRERSSSEGNEKKQKRSDRDQDRREERKEQKRQPPKPPPPPHRDHSEQFEIRLTTSKRKARPAERQDQASIDEESECIEKPSRSRKKNKGKTHRDRGRAYRAWREGVPDGS